MYEVTFIHSVTNDIGLHPSHTVIRDEIKSQQFSKKIYWLPTLWGTINFLNKPFLKNLINDLKNDAYFIYDISTEPVKPDVVNDNLAPLINLFKQNKISLKKLIVLSPTPQSLFGTYDYGYLFFNSLIYNFVHKYKTSKIFNLTSDKQFKKHFLSLSRKDTLERRYINYLLHTENLFDKGLVSHARAGIRIRPNLSDVETAKQDFNFIRRNNLDKQNYIKYGFKRHFLDTNAMNNHELYDKLYVNNFETHQSLSNNVFCELVNETNAYGSDSLFITEKILKPIISRNLFIIIANPFVLSFLRKLGFKTFPHIFEESYDYEIDDVKRTKIVFENLKRYCAISMSDCKKIYDDNRELLDYNYNHLLKTTWDFTIKNRVERYITKESLQCMK